MAGTSTVNLHSKTLQSIVLSLVSQHLAASCRVYLTSNASSLLMNDLLATAMSDGQLSYFVDVQRTEGLAKLLTRSIRDLRLAGLSANDLRDDAFESAEKAADIRTIYESYIQALSQRSLIDYADCLELARQLLGDGSCPIPPTLRILEPEEFHASHLEKAFLDSLEQKTGVLRPGNESRDRISVIRDLRPAFFSGYGEFNEVRGAMQHVVGVDANETRRLDDVEILYTDESYVPLLYEFMTEYVPSGEKSVTTDPPISFGDGIATIYTRPGRALRGWLRWTNSDGLQSKLVQLIREGVLNRPETADNEQPIG